MEKCTCTDRNYEAGEHDHTYIDLENGNYLCDSCDGFVDYPDYDPDSDPDSEDSRIALTWPDGTTKKVWPDRRP